MRLRRTAGVMWMFLFACSTAPARREFAPKWRDSNGSASMHFPPSGSDGFVLSDGKIRVEAGEVLFLPFAPHGMTPKDDVRIFGSFDGPDFNGSFYGHLEVRRPDGALLLALNEGGWEGTDEISVKKGRVTALLGDRCARRRRHAVRFTDQRTGDSIKLVPGETGTLGRWAVFLVNAEVARAPVGGGCLDPSSTGLRYVISEVRP